MNKVMLISTLHDPEGNMPEFLPKCMDYLMDIYSCLVIVATPTTSQKTIDIIINSKAEIHLTGNRHIGESRYKSLKLGLKHKEIEYFHYCDFDRLLHWTLNYADELRSIVTYKIPQWDFLIIGRNDTAFNTHPYPQRKTEIITNRIFSFIFGKVSDVTAGSCSMGRVSADRIIKLSTEISNATDVEWPLIIQRMTPFRIGYVKVQGLEYETTTFFGDKALKQAQSTGNWFRRIGFCRNSIEAIIRMVIQHRKCSAI